MNFKNIFVVASIFVALGMTACGSNTGNITSIRDKVKTITGVAGKGAAIEGRVELFDENNNLLGSTTNFKSNGTYTISNISYKGKIQAVLTLSKYRDEVLEKNVFVDDLTMKAVTYIDSSNNSINITPITDIAVSSLGDNPLANTQAQIEEVNRYVAKTMGMGDINPVKEPFTFVSKNDGDLTDTPSHRYALALLAISKYSAIEDSNNKTVIKTKVDKAIKDLYNAVVESSVSNIGLENIIERINGIGTHIKGVKDSDIINHDTIVPISSTIEKIMPGASFKKIRTHIEDRNAPAPTLEDYAKLGIDGVDKYNLNAVNEAVVKAGSIPGTAGAYTAAEIQAIVQEVNYLVKLLVIYAKANTRPAPGVQEYSIAGIVGVTTDNIDAVNKALCIATVGGRAVKTASDIQNLVDNLPAPLPAGVTITTPTLTATLVSTIDTVYDADIDIDGNIPSSGLLVKVPYHSNRDVTLSDFTSSPFIVDASNTKSGNAVDVRFQWSGVTLSAGDGYFDAKIIPGAAYHAKQLNLNEDGYRAATFLYPTDHNSSIGQLDLKVIPGIPDRNFNVLTNGQYEHQFVYMLVTNPFTGRVWLNNNLGAEYANLNSSSFNSMQQATASDDYRAYGSLFQWGRKADGHELINWEDIKTGIAKYGTTTTKSDDPDFPEFIIGDGDWRVTPDDTLWASESSPNSVCPVGYRLPLDPNGAAGEDNEFESWVPQDAIGYMFSELKLPLVNDYLIVNRSNKIEAISRYWSGSANFGSNASYGWFGTNMAYSPVISTKRGVSMFVRCIRDWRNRAIQF